MSLEQFIEIGPASHPRDGVAGVLCRHCKTDVYVLRVGGAYRSFPPKEGRIIEHGANKAAMQGQAPLGRPPEYGETMRSFPAKLTEAQRAYVLEHGGAAFIRALIDKERGGE